MWTLALVILLVIGNKTAIAFDCVGVKLPSSIVICSDIELMRLADERQEAINEARGRIGEERWPELWEDQKAWVRSYATVCGVAPDLPPPIPVPPTVKACFKRAGEARIAYLRSYGVTASNIPGPAPLGGLSPDHIGPGFDCSKAAAPLALMICADPELSRVDFRFNQAYWALFQQSGPAGQNALKQEDIKFIYQVQDQCGVPRSGMLSPQVWQARDRVRAAYENMRSSWLARLTGAAREEATRPIERHLALQKALQDLAFIPAGSVDGVYGATTRAGIAAWQSARGRVVTGLLGDADARAIEQELVGRQALAEPGRDSLPQSQHRLGFEAATLQRDEVPLKNMGHIYAVPVRINDAITLDFVIDSGAADVLLPADVVLTLVRTGTLTEADFIGKKTYTLADGSELKSAQFILREVSVGHFSLSNVAASIGPVKGGLLLGQSFLSRFDSWALDNGRHILALSSRPQ